LCSSLSDWTLFVFWMRELLDLQLVSPLEQGYGQHWVWLVLENWFCTSKGKGGCKRKPFNLGLILTQCLSSTRRYHDLGLSLSQSLLGPPSQLRSMPCSRCTLLCKWLSDCLFLALGYLFANWEIPVTMVTLEVYGPLLVLSYQNRFWFGICSEWNEKVSFWSHGWWKGWAYFQYLVHQFVSCFPSIEFEFNSSCM
jgi:hypothetical protein